MSFLIYLWTGLILYVIPIQYKKKKACGVTYLPFFFLFGSTAYALTLAMCAMSSRTLLE